MTQPFEERKICGFHYTHIYLHSLSLSFSWYWFITDAFIPICIFILYIGIATTSIRSYGNEKGRLEGPYTIGARADSYYEYLLKLWIQTGKTNDEYKNRYVEAINAVLNRMLAITDDGLFYIAELHGYHVRTSMEHLACFFPGMLALGWHHGLGRRIDGIAPVKFRSNPSSTRKTPTSSPEDLLEEYDEVNDDDVRGSFLKQYSHFINILVTMEVKSTNFMRRTLIQPWWCTDQSIITSSCCLLSL